MPAQRASGVDAARLDNGLQQRLFDYWILGKSGEERPPRWSILRDMLGVGLDQENEAEEVTESNSAT